MLKERYISSLKKEWVLNAFFFLFLIVCVGQRIWLFFTVNINFIDNDQPIMWLGAKHFSKGLFYEPRFYGQDYNTMMEALFAVPLIKIGLPVYYAVPIATHLIFLTPFLFSSLFLFIMKQKEKALFVLGILMCMPVAYDIMNSIPRGFVTGLFFTSLMVISLVNVKDYRFILINTFLAYVGFLVNQNSVVVTGPVLFYLFLNNYRDRKYYMHSFIGIVLALPVDYLLNHFYKVHLNYVFYPANNHYSLSYFTEAITHLDQRFAHVSLFIEERCFVLLILFMVVGLFLYKSNINLFYSFLVFLLVIFVSFFSSKVSDGIVWPFYSYSRMYLGVPILLVLLMIGSSLDFKKIMTIFIPIILIFTIYKEINFTKSLAYHRQEKMWGHVHLNTLKEIRKTVRECKEICIKHGVSDFIIINSVWHDDEINYAGPALYDDFPNTLKPSFERRTWRMEEERNRIHEQFIVYVADENFDKTTKQKYPFMDITKLNYYSMFHIKNNKLTTAAFLKAVNATTIGY